MWDIKLMKLFGRRKITSRFADRKYINLYYSFSSVLLKVKKGYIKDFATTLASKDYSSPSFHHFLQHIPPLVFASHTSRLLTPLH